MSKRKDYGYPYSERQIRRFKAAKKASFFKETRCKMLDYLDLANDDCKYNEITAPVSVLIFTAFNVYSNNAFILLLLVYNIF